MRSRKKTADAMARVWAASFRPESRVLSAEKGRCRSGGCRRRRRRRCRQGTGATEPITRVGYVMQLLDLWRAVSQSWGLGNSGALTGWVGLCSSLSSRHSTIQDAVAGSPRCGRGCGRCTGLSQTAGPLPVHPTFSAGSLGARPNLAPWWGMPSWVLKESKIYSAFHFPFPFLSPTRPLDSAGHRTHNRFRHSVVFPTRVLLMKSAISRRGEESRSHKSRPSIVSLFESHYLIAWAASEAPYMF